MRSTTAQCVPLETPVKMMARETKFANGTRLSRHAQLVRGSLNVEARLPTALDTDRHGRERPIQRGPDQTGSILLLLPRSASTSTLVLRLVTPVARSSSNSGCSMMVLLGRTARRGQGVKGEVMGGPWKSFGPSPDATQRRKRRIGQRLGGDTRGARGVGKLPMRQRQ